MLLFRLPQEKDTPDIFRMNEDEEIKRFCWLEEINSYEMLAEWLLRMNNLEANGVGTLVIEQQEQGKSEFVGLMGVRTTSVHKQVAVFYRIGQHFRNKGIATFSVSYLLEYIKKEFAEIKEIIAEIHFENHPSKRVVQKLGFEFYTRSAQWETWKIKL